MKKWDKEDFHLVSFNMNKNAENNSLKIFCILYFFFFFQFQF